MEKLKRAVELTVMNEDAMLEKIMQSAPKTQLGHLSSKPVWLKVGLAFSLVLFLVLARDIFLPKENSVTIGHVTANDKLAYAMVGIDINPSFELYIDMEDIVIDVRALNTDAETLNLNALIGLPVNQAVGNVIEMAKSAGFLDVTGAKLDTIIISTVSFGADGSRLISELKLALLSSRAIDRTVRTYVIEGDEDDFEASEEKNLPLGLYLINGMIRNDGVTMSVAEFVSDTGNLEILEEMAEHATDSEMISVIRALIDELKKSGFDVSGFETRLNRQGEDLEELIEDLKDAFDPEDDEVDNSIDDDSDSGSTEGSWSESDETEDHEDEEEDD